MKTFNFPYIAIAIGLFLLLVVMKGSEVGSDGSTAMPLLTLLIVSEFSFFVTAIATWIGVKHVRNVGPKPAYVIVTLVCFLLAIRFMLYGFTLWPS